MRALGLWLVATACSSPPPPHPVASPTPAPPATRDPDLRTPSPPPPPPAPPPFDPTACARAIDSLTTCDPHGLDRDALAAACPANPDACLVAAAAFSDAAHYLPASYELLPDPTPKTPWIYAPPAPLPFPATSTPDLDRARTLFAGACPKHPLACVAAGTPALGCPGSIVACAAALNQSALVTACKHSPSATACNPLAFLSHSRTDHLVACANHSLLSCISLVEANQPGPRDMGADLFALFDDACHETGRERACFAAIKVIESGWGGVYWRNQNAVEEILSTACNEVHSAKACKRLAKFDRSTD